MIRLLMILGMVVAIFWIIKQLFRFFLVRWLKNLQANAAPFQAAKVNDLSEKLVQCAYCRTFIPENKAVQARQQSYCSAEHSKL